MNNTVPYTDMKDSGIKWIGSVPASWNVRTLYQLATRVNNKNSDLSEQNLLSLSYGKIKRKDINTNDGLLPASFDGYNIIEAGDIVLRLTDLQNDHTSLRVGHATERGIITSAYTTLRPLNPAHSRYLYYLIHAFDLKKGFYGMGSGVRQGLNYDEVKELRVVLPSQREQDAIVTFLDEQCAKIDELIREAKGSIEEYTTWKAAVISEVVTKGLNPSAKMVQSGLPVYSYRPGHWRSMRVKDVATVIRGGSPRPIEEYLTDDADGYNWIKIGDTTKGRKYITSTHQKIKPSGLSKTRLVHKGDLLLTNSMSFGQPYILDIDGCIHDGWVCLSDIHTVSKEYLYYFLCSELCMMHFHLQVAGGVVQNLNVDKIGSTKIFVPTKEEQDAIVQHLDDKCGTIEALIDEKQALINDMESYKFSLVYESITGKRKVV